MRRVYSRVRIALMTFTLGLAAVWMVNVFSIADCDYPVEVPAAVSADVLYIFPVEEKYIGPTGGHGGGYRTETYKCRDRHGKMHLCVR